MNVYSELLELLSPEPSPPLTGMLGTVMSHDPLTITVRGTPLTDGLIYPFGMVFDAEDIGRTVALLPWESGFLILFFTEGGGT